MSQIATRASIIVLGNEKGGAGKSTIALHIATALMHGGARLGVIDLDLRQQSLGRFFLNRDAWARANGVEVPMPHRVLNDADISILSNAAEPELAKAAFDQVIASFSAEVDFILIDTPGADTPLSRAAHARADE